MTLLNEFADLLAAARSDFVVAQTQIYKTLFLLVHESLQHDVNALVADVVSREIELFDGLRKTETLLHGLDACKTDLILLDAEHLQILLVFELLPQRNCSFSKDAVHAQ